MILLRLNVVVGLLVWCLLGCRPNIDPALRPYVGLNKDHARFLAMTVDQQMDTYLKVAALPLKPPDYSLSPLIATSNGNIGNSLAEHINHESSGDRIIYLVRLAGDYCDLNASCKGQHFLEEAVRTAITRIPEHLRNSYLEQNVKLVAEGVAGLPMQSPEPNH